MRFRHAAVLALTLLLAAAAFAVEASRDGTPAPVMDIPRVATTGAADGATDLSALFPVREAPADWSAVDPAAVRWAGGREILDDGVHPPRELPVDAGAVVALPVRAAPRWRVTGWTWLREPDGPVDVAAQVHVDAVRVLRGVPVVGVRVRPETPGGGLLGRVDVRLEHGPVGEYAAALTAVPATADGKRAAAPAPGRGALANPELYDRLHAGLAAARSEAAKNGEPHAFQRSDNWLRLEVGASGVHELTAFQAGAAGMDNAAADPATFRLYRAWPEALELDPELDGSWQEDWDGLTEVALDLGATGATWSTGDAVRFYAAGPDAWRDRIDAAAGRLERREHPFSSTVVYWLTWEEFGTPSPFAGAPLRVTSRSLPAHGGAATASHLKRLHLEEQAVEAFGYVRDNWVWTTTVSNTRAIEVPTPDAVAGQPAFFSVEVRANYGRGDSSSLGNSAQAWLNSDLAAAASIDWTISQEDDSLRIRAVGWSGALRRGDNILTLANTSTDPNKVSLMLDSVDLLYRAELAKTGGALPFVHWGEEVAAADTPVDLALAVPAGRSVTVWDVTDPARPEAVTGSGGTGGITLGLTRGPDTDRHFLAFENGDVLATVARERRTPGVLRGLDRNLDYVILYADELEAAAGQLRDHRAGHLPGIASPRVAAVPASEIFDAFGGGVRDPLALRNFLKWVWTGGAGRLQSVCFLGDASRDYRDFRGIFADMLPTWINVEHPTLMSDYQNFPFASDDRLASFDRAPFASYDAPDLACGRLTVRTPEEAAAQVARIASYDASPEPGSWRNRMVMAADDLTQPSSPDAFERAHTDMAEELSNSFIPATLDVHKVYLMDYPAPSGSQYKPQARQAARSAWNDGLTVFHYIGHGSDNVLADEQLFLTDDILGLNNGARRGLFLAFSCDVCIYDQVTKQSMAETFVAQEGGAAIAAIAASQVSWISSNNNLTRYFYTHLFPGDVVDPDVTLGAALWQAKVSIADFQSTFDVANSQRYLLCGDPMLSLPHPAGGPGFAATSLDTLRGGRREEAVFVLSDHGLTPGASVSYDLLVQEARQDKNYTRDFRSLDWWLPGAATFHGTGTVTDDTLRVPFKVPLQLRYGDHGKVRLIVNTSATEAVAAALDLPVAQAATGATDDSVGPRIALAFADNRYRVKPGTLLHAVVDDTSGVSILGTNPLNSVLVEYDGTGVLSDVSDAFEFDPGSYTSGRLSVPVPDDLESGDHEVALFASDVLGNVGSDTLSFKLVAGAVGEIADATVWPNPTPGPTSLVFELSDPMTLTWTLYTVAGHRIWSDTAAFDSAGPKVMRWDGRDAEGDEVANGVYLYVLKGSWADADHPVTVTGQVVKMK